MTNGLYAIRLESKSALVSVDFVVEKLKHREFGLTEPGVTAPAASLCFDLKTSAYTIYAQMEPDANAPQQVRRVTLTINVLLTPMDAAHAVASDLLAVTYDLAHEENGFVMAIYCDGLPEGEPEKSLCCGNPYDVARQIQSLIKQQKRALSRFAKIDPEEALQYMQDFPKRKEEFIASIRKGKDRDLSA